MTNAATHYDNLKVTPDAPEEVIRASYKALLQIYHPEKFVDCEEEAINAINIIKASYDVLMTPETRSEYDKWLKEQRREGNQATEKLGKLAEASFIQQQDTSNSTGLIESKSVSSVKRVRKRKVKSRSKSIFQPILKWRLNSKFDYAIAGVVLLIVLFSLANTQIVQQTSFGIWPESESKAVMMQNNSDRPVQELKESPPLAAMTQ